jgi:hypothetical protein
MNIYNLPPEIQNEIDAARARSEELRAIAQKDNDRLKENNIQFLEDKRDDYKKEFEKDPDRQAQEAEKINAEINTEKANYYSRQTAIDDRASQRLEELKTIEQEAVNKQLTEVEKNTAQVLKEQQHIEDQERAKADLELQRRLEQDRNR